GAGMCACSSGRDPHRRRGVLPIEARPGAVASSAHREVTIFYFDASHQLSRAVASNGTVFDFTPRSGGSLLVTITSADGTIKIPVEVPSSSPRGNTHGAPSW